MNRDYELAMVNLEMYYSFTNIRKDNNSFEWSVGGKTWTVIHVPTGCYELKAINTEIISIRGNSDITILPNVNTLQTGGERASTGNLWVGDEQNTTHFFSQSDTHSRAVWLMYLVIMSGAGWQMAKKGVVTKGKYRDYWNEIQQSYELGFTPYRLHMNVDGIYVTPIHVYDGSVHVLDYVASMVIGGSQIETDKIYSKMIYFVVVALQGDGGPSGARGLKGDSGGKGSVGNQGPAGKHGAEGPGCPPGKIGKMGPVGSKSDAGVCAEIGDKGVAGGVGQQGPVWP